jgi:hypothetical protein
VYCNFYVFRQQARREMVLLRIYVNNTEMDLREIGWGGMDWVHVAQDRDQLRAFVNTLMKFRTP